MDKFIDYSALQDVAGQYCSIPAFVSRNVLWTKSCDETRSCTNSSIILHCKSVAGQYSSIPAFLSQSVLCTRSCDLTCFVRPKCGLNKKQNKRWNEQKKSSAHPHYSQTVCVCAYALVGLVSLSETGPRLIWSFSVGFFLRNNCTCAKFSFFLFCHLWRVMKLTYNVENTENIQNRAWSDKSKRSMDVQPSKPGDVLVPFAQAVLKSSRVRSPGWYSLLVNM